MKLPVVSGRTVGKVLESVGYEFAGQAGSHRHYRHLSPPHVKITVPDHHELKRSTLKSILRAAGLSNEQFDVRWREL